MSKKQDALAVARDITEEFEGRAPLRKWNPKTRKDSPRFGVFCPACSFDTVPAESGVLGGAPRFCRGEIRPAPWYWPWGDRRVVCDEDRPHLHCACTNCGWRGIFAAGSEDA